MDKKYQVFVSSTYEDLKQERSAVIAALLKAGFIPTGMEYFTATSKTQWEVIEEIIPQCDYYIVIVAGKYGSIEPVSGISYTEKEYDLAISSGVPAIGFLFKDISKLTFENVEEKEEVRTKLNAFREKVKKHLCDFWTNKDNLANVVTNSLNAEIKKNPRIGWVKADKISEQKNVEEVNAFLNTIVDLHICHSIFSFDTNDTIEERMTVSLQWGDIVAKVCGLMSVPLTYQGAKEEISSLWNGVVESDVLLIINTLVSKGILEAGSESVEGLGVQNYCTVTSYGHQVLADYLTKNNSELALRDRKMLVRLMENFSTRLMDNYLIDGPYMVEHDLLTSFEACEAIVSASSFTLYGETINNLWNPFYESWKEAMNHGEWYESFDVYRYKFHGLQHDIFVTNNDEKNFNHLTDNRNKLQRLYHDFICYVKDTCKLNVEETSKKFEQEMLKMKHQFKVKQ